jgi:magnesium chelatase family protein
VGTHFDLPICLGLLVASGQVEPGEEAEKDGFLGELALDGSVRPVSGVLPMAAAARKAGIFRLIVPEGNQEEAEAAGLQAIGVRNLRELVLLLKGRKLKRRQVKHRVCEPPAGVGDELSDIRGQLLGKRVLEIAAVGGHNLLMIGPPGAGKSMLARCLPGLLPPMTRNEAMDVTKLLSISGRLRSGGGLEGLRPFRSPHTTASAASLVGGGSDARPGEFSMAHNGVLFLDEFAEFPRSSLEALRQPMEEKAVTVARIKRTVRYPADFLLVAAMNPCPCGYRGAKGKQCICTPYEAQRYRRKISGPMMDRVDLQVELTPIDFAEWSGRSLSASESSKEVRDRVIAVRRRTAARAGREGANAGIPVRHLKAACALDKKTWDFVEWTADRFRYSPRALDRLLRVSRTIADMDDSENVRREHVSEALQYRLRWVGDDGTNTRGIDA